MMVGIISVLESIGKVVFLVLVNTSLQVTLLIFLIWSMIWIFRPRSAVARYYLWFLAVLGILALPLLSALLPGISISIMRSEETTISPTHASGIDVDDPSNTRTYAADIPREAPSKTEQRTTQRKNFWTNAFHPFRRFSLISIISLAWFLIALSMLSRLMGSYIWLRRFKKKSQRVADGSILEIMSRLRERMSLTSRIEVFMSSDIHSPTSFGLFSTTIILPESLTNSRDEELEMVLSHEMAHAKRHDFLVNLFQKILQSVFFFHPLLNIANRRLTREREHICDDWVIEVTGRRDDYAECLIGLVENAYYPRSIGVAIVEHRHNISRRVDMIIDNSRGAITKISRRAGISIFLMGCILLPVLAAPQIIYNAEPKEPMEFVSGILDTEERFNISNVPEEAEPRGGGVERTIEQEERVKIDGIPDPNLAAAIREALGKPDGAVTEDDLQSITKLEALNNNIRGITGIERCVNLESLALGAIWNGTEWESSNNRIEDISPLKGLTKLVYLNLADNKISDIGPLSNLTNLTGLYLNYNKISDIRPLSNLTKLMDLHLGSNPISDIAPLSNLTKLNKLWLNRTRIDRNDLAVVSSFTNLTLLDIEENGIDGGLAFISNLTNLEHLFANHNQISDVTPLSNLTKLTMLGLSVNQISDVAPLSNLTKLTMLSVNENQVTDATPLANLTSLELLWLGDNPIDGDVAFLANFTNLTYLYLRSSRISDVTFLSNLTDLNILWLTWNQITDVSPLANLTKLTELYIYGNQISDVKPLSNLTNLNILRINKNQITDVSPLASLTNLTELNLNSNGIIDIAPLSNLTNLTSLSLVQTYDRRHYQLRNQISDVKPLSNLTNLKELRLGRNLVSNIAPLYNLTNLTHLELYNNQIDDIRPLSNLTNLILLNLIDNQISDISPLANLTNLAELHLAGCEISNDDLAFLAGLTNLTLLNLIDNQISDVSSLVSLINLTMLYLADNHISDASPLSKLTGLKKLNLSENPLSGVTSLLNFTNLAELHLAKNGIGDDDLAFLASLTNLTLLNLIDNQITDPSPLSKLINLEKLYLGDNPMSNVTSLSDLTNLTVLYLSSNQISDASPLSKLTGLKKLNLSENPLSGVTFLASLTNLTELYLGKTGIIDDLTFLSGLTNLTHLGLSSNQISDIDPLSNLTNLTWLELHGNQISDVIPLVENEGLGKRDEVDLQQNPLNDETYKVYIPALEKRGIRLKFDPNTES